MRLAEGDRFPRMGEDGTFIRRLNIDRADLVIVRDRQPRLARGEARARRLRFPGQGRAAAIASLHPRVIEIAHRIADVVPVEIGFRQAKFFALIHQHIALEREQECQRQFRERVVALAPAPARHGARHVMVRKGHAGKEVFQRRKALFIIGAEDRRLEAPVLDEIERIAGMKPLRPACIEPEHFRPLGKLAEGEPVVIFVQHLAHALHRPLVLRHVGIVDVLLQARRMRPVHEIALLHRQRRIVGELRVMQIGIRHIEAEAIHTSVEPEAQHIHAGFHHFLIVEVELRLALQELVMVILPPNGIPRPSLPAESRQPVVRYRAVFLRIGPDIPVRLRIVGGELALLKPGMPLGCMRQHLIHDHPDAAPMCRLHQPVEILKRPHLRRDIAIIRDVIAEVAIGRGIEGRKPDRLCAERRHMVELLLDAFQVAHAVAIRVAETARVNLIDDRTLPPFRLPSRHDASSSAVLTFCPCPHSLTARQELTILFSGEPCRAAF